MKPDTEIIKEFDEQWSNPNGVTVMETPLRRWILSALSAARADERERCVKEIRAYEGRCHARGSGAEFVIAAQDIAYLLENDISLPRRGEDETTKIKP